MANFKLDILEEVGDEVVEGIVIGYFGWGRGVGVLAHGEEDVPLIPWEVRGCLLSPYEALGLLDYDYDTSFGAPECHAVYIWTNKRVIWVTQYDGSTSLDSVPRNPVDIWPNMPGG